MLIMEMAVICPEARLLDRGIMKGNMVTTDIISTTNSIGITDTIEIADIINITDIIIERSAW
jgi:hypothetical protein